ncbi:hypothetical protein JCM33374_g2826 [Metschnikowia sp. JCM 33374]|nr:hypothetical protein JCM33374_g2826 [Metschnikowia sp. JCM 33374]
MENTVYIPIPHYPPFKLRSSLIDKDPVIWVHLLEGYIKLCGVLLTGEVKLDVKSQQQFQLFIKIFLAETSEEKTKIFSLGAINPDIKSNTATLRAYVFQIICDYGAVKLALNGESLWNFVMVYVEKNASLVRGIVAGSHKSKFNDNKKSGKISSIPVLRKYLISMIAHGRMQNFHLEFLTMLLGQHVAAPSTKTVHVTSAGKASKGGKMLAKDKYKQSSSSATHFAELFVTEDWIEELESMYAGGKSVHAETIKTWMVISVLSLSVSKLANVVSTIGIQSAGTMILAPLLSTIILSDAYKRLNPGLEERLPFLRNITFEAPQTVANADVDFLLEMFPDLSQAKARKLLLRYDNNIDKTTNAVLENLSLIEEVSDSESEGDLRHSSPSTVSGTELERGLNRFKLSSHETTERFGKKAAKANASEIKKNTLTAALRLLYDSDEDERDDTYDDQEHTSGAAFTDSEKKSKAKDKVVVYEDDGDSSKNSLGNSNRSSAAPEFDPNEVLLFGYLKSGGDSLFDKGNRKSSQRKDMRLKTGWTDEQIEGWRPKKDQELDGPDKASDKQEKGSGDTVSTDNTEKKSADRISQRRKETNKAKRANHSRKSGHNKKTRAELAGMQ